ncbi:MAG: NADH-quinone oxidoreductase subunit L [Actinobacteria bacterium]|jgi:NADH-quinone oxidoreductase subunit L|nr:NADH-quinone oxidoreductase subunit L [Actinomycetota bacterium]NBO34711.1 NADH-quinone oxidoreductase subunit L [Actinomycetota bacterium]
MIAALIGLPLLGATVLLLGGRRTNVWGHFLAVAMSGASFVLGAFLFIQMAGKSEEEREVGQHLFDWISVGAFQVPFGLHLDQLSIVFVLLITGVGTLIHIYSIGYMEHDPNRRRFFAYLNLFVAAMLLLVLADNYFLLYVGWEGVGLASYLLISYYQQKPSAATAGKKAFIVNRVGDVGLSLAIILMFVTFGTVTFEGVNAAAEASSPNTITWIGLALLLAACGKSAQFPLQSWLLDAMEGPTPVSALIHAATMVTAGVYLIVRAHAIFDLSETARTAVVIVGAITLLLGAFIGTAKDDIKKGLAGSTMSQIGYMVLAAGLGPVGYVFAIFHLLTHGMFKAGLFLGAGSVMHGMHDDVNMRHYGALRTMMKITYATFGLGFLAIIGVPPFAGFWSKDEIIHAAFSQSLIIGMATLIGAGVTAFYMTRMMTMTFFGEARWEDDVHPHESPAVMTIPMIILAFGSVFGGMAMLFVGDIEHWLEPITGFAKPEHSVSNTVLIPITLAVVFGGALFAWLRYGRRPVPVIAPSNVSFLTRAARADAYGDALNESVFMRPGQYLTRSLTWFDSKAIDGLVSGLAAAIGGLSARARRLQNGYVRSYALTMLGGAVLIALVLLLVRL